MSHRNDCPDPYTAEREGRRAGDDGYRSRYSNPYRDECEEAADRWDRGYRSGEYDREEREAEEQRARVARERRYQEQEFEREYYYQQDFSEADYYAQQAEAYYEEQYDMAVQDDLHIERVCLAYENIVAEALGELSI